MNAFCTLEQFFVLYDRRVFAELSSDDANRDGDMTRVQTILDMQASKLESAIAGRYSLPLASVPGVLTEWVAVKTAERLYGRRNDKPSAIEKDAKLADDWLKDLIDGRVSLKGIDRSVVPDLSSSEFKDGRSRFDRVLGSCPSLDGTSKGK